MKALGCQPVESTSLSKFWFQIVNLHPLHVGRPHNRPRLQGALGRAPIPTLIRRQGLTTILQCTCTGHVHIMPLYCTSAAHYTHSVIQHRPIRAGCGALAFGAVRVWIRRGGGVQVHVPGSRRACRRKGGHWHGRRAGESFDTRGLLFREGGGFVVPGTTVIYHHTRVVRVINRSLRGFSGTRRSVGRGELGMIVYLHIERCTGTT